MASSLQNVSRWVPVIVHAVAVSAMSKSDSLAIDSVAFLQESRPTGFASNPPGAGACGTVCVRSRPSWQFEGSRVSAGSS